MFFYHSEILGLWDLVLCTTDTTITKRQISKSAKELGYTELAVAKDIRIIEEIPLFATGKVNYPKLKEDIGLGE